MNIPLLTHLVHLIELLFEQDAPAIEQAAAAAAVSTAKQDPQVQAVTAASAAFLEAAKNLKAAVAVPPAEPPAA